MENKFSKVLKAFKDIYATGFRNGGDPLASFRYATYWSQGRIKTQLGLTLQQ